jgi:hypothetical protein
LKTSSGKRIRFTVEFLAAKDHPSSCFTLTGAIACGLDTEPAKILMREMRLQNEAAIKARLLKARKAGEFPNAGQAAGNNSDDANARPAVTKTDVQIVRRARQILNSPSV